MPAKPLQNVGYGGAVRLIRTRLCQDSDAVPYAAPRLHHSGQSSGSFEIEMVPFGEAAILVEVIEGS